MFQEDWLKYNPLPDKVQENLILFISSYDMEFENTYAHALLYFRLAYLSCTQ